MSAKPSAGWYADPSDPSRLRWWDGGQWTDQRMPRPGATAPPVQPATQARPPLSQSVSEDPSRAEPAVVNAYSAQVPRMPDAVRQTLLEPPKTGGFLGGKKHLEQENAQLRAAFAQLGVTDREQITAEIARLRGEHGAVLAALRAERQAAEAELASLRAKIVPVAEEAILQEVGIYRYSHPLDSAVAYKERLSTIQAQVKDMAKGDRAVVGITNWTVNGSPREGNKMVRDFSKLMLRAYNNEADNAVRSMKPHLVDSAVERLVKARSTISKLGKTMQIEITDEYHSLRVQELLLTADYLAKVAEQKEREREEKARLREEEVARREYERERQRLEKEAAHYQAALAVMRANGDLDAVADAESKLKEIQAAIEGVDYRAANVRAGYVYVISNVGSFGPRMVKIGMTRRLEPLDRVRELGDASVPFRYDVHAIIFSEDAVGLEGRLHQEFASLKVNLVNAHREFFYATPDDVRRALESIDGPSLLHFEANPEALEWHQSENLRPARASEDLATS